MIHLGGSHIELVSCTVHASEVGLPQDGSDPQLLGVHVRPHQVVPRGCLHHGLQLTAHPVPLGGRERPHTDRQRVREREREIKSQREGDRRSSESSTD